MGSLLGNYIHYSWTNYENYGTYRSVREWKNEENQKSNFQSDIFDKHKESTLKLIKKLSHPNLKALEVEYNNKIKEQSKAMLELQKISPHQYTIIVEALIKSLGSSYAAISNQILSNLVWDDSRQTFRYSLAKGANSDNIETPPYYKLGVTSGRGESRPRIAYCDLLIEYIKRVSGNSKHPDIEKLKRIRDTLKKHQSAYIEQKKIFNKGKEQNKYQDLSFQYANAIDNYLQKIRGGYIEAVDIDKRIQAAFAEFIGNVIGEDLTTIGISEITKALTVGKTLTIKNVDTTGMTIKLDISAIESWAKEQKKKKSIKSLSTTLNGKNNRVSYDFYSTLGGAVDQKADIEVNLLGSSYGISIKNTNFYAKTSTDSFNIPHISLQSSTFALYLAAIQKEWPDLGNHYLNIFTHHNDASGVTYAQMHKQASQALTLYILYSALSGQGQLRANKGTANIFAIYDKASSKDPAYPRVKFFDMADVLIRYSQYSNGYDVIYPNPNSKEFLLKNTWEDSSSSARITKVLLEARTKNLSATLSTEMLRKLYNET